MSRAHVEYETIGEGPHLPLVLDGVSSGGRTWVLSRDGVTGAETRFVRLPELFHWHDPGSFASEIEIYVLRGAVRFGGSELRAGDYAVYHEGARIEALDTESGCEMLWMASGRIEFTLGGTARPLWHVGPLHVPALPWQASPAYEGRTAVEAGEGLWVKFLRGDPAGGAYTLLTRHDAGWADSRLESHDTWEELVLLEGEFLMGNTGVVRAGTYIFRPGLRPHGPQASRSGATWLARGARSINFRFDAPEWVAERSRRYLASGSLERDASRPWGDIT